MKKTLTCLVSAVALASLLTAAPAEASDDGGVISVAHRGASGSAPENTMASMALAFASRADFVEFDVQLTKDGVPVLLHDRSLARTTDVEQVFPGRSPWLVGDFTWAELRTLDAGSWRAASYRGERIPTLGAVLRALAASPNGAQLEVKNPGAHGGMAGIGETVYASLRQNWPDALTDAGRRRLRVVSSDSAFAQAFAEAHPDVPVGVVSTFPRPEVAAFAAMAAVYWGNVTPELATQLHSDGVRLGTWTVNSPEVAADLTGYVDSITTNWPSMLRDTLAGQAELYTGTDWPSRSSQHPTWQLQTVGRYLDSPVRVRALLTDPWGNPAPWQRASVQRLVNGTWRTLVTRGTDAAGRFAAWIRPSRDLTLRVITRDRWQYPITGSARLAVRLYRRPTTVTLSGPTRVRRYARTTLQIRWRTSDGRAVSGKARFYRYSNHRWTYIRDVKVTNGAASTWVRPARATSYQIRAYGGWWFSGSIDNHRVAIR